ILSGDALPPFSGMLLLVARYCIVWILQGIGFACALKALAPIPFNSILPVIGGNALAWLAGFLVLVTPAGLGVREIMLTRILKSGFGSGPAAMAAVIARLFIVCSELLGSAVLLIFGHSRR
ncbi:hypothetical protein JXA80_13150, partial [bacterium]|nr:hypothetical protein [candidate division CSSED10-310 bacterium]